MLMKTYDNEDREWSEKLVNLKEGEWYELMRSDHDCVLSTEHP